MGKRFAPETGLKLAKERAGSVEALAVLCGVTHQAVSKWKRIPVHHVHRISGKLGIALEVLRPDVYRPQSIAAE
jgi:hypothetical protein